MSKGQELTQYMKAAVRGPSRICNCNLSDDWHIRPQKVVRKDVYFLSFFYQSFVFFQTIEWPLLLSLVLLSVNWNPAVVAEWSKALSNVHTSSILRSQVQIPLGAIDNKNSINTAQKTELVWVPTCQKDRSWHSTWKLPSEAHKEFVTVMCQMTEI